MWRVNLYDTRCSVCKEEVLANEGFFRIENESRRMYCAKHKAQIDAGIVPDGAPAVKFKDIAPANAAPIDMDALAEKTASLTFTKVAEHFSAHVQPGVEASLPALVRSELQKMVRIAEIKVGKAPSVKMDKSHRMLPTIVQAVVAGASPFLVGPAGSGKTTLAEQVAKALNLKFYMAARVTSEFKLIGFVDARGSTVRTQFREAFEFGGVFLFDEVDASDPDSLTAFNAALSNGLGDFPDGMVHKHKDFYAIAAGNTFGRGADRQYVGRNQLDAATLDRFEVFEVDYDEDLEHELAGNLEWSTYVQSIRAAIQRQQVRHIVSPRASIRGARMLAAGMDRKVVEDATIWKGLEAGVRQRLERA